MIAVPGDDCERPRECRGDPADVRMKGAVLGARVLDPNEQQIVSLFCLLRDRLFGRSVVAANGYIDRGGVLVSPLPRLDFVGGGFDHFLDAICRTLRIALAGLSFLRKRQNRDRNSVGAGQKTWEGRRRVVVPRAVDSTAEQFE